MHVEVNEANIDLYDLVKLTGNSREDMLSAAADARRNGTVLSCNVPDDQVVVHNVFDVYESEHVDPARLNGCGYEYRETEDNVYIAVCVIHGKTSRHDVRSDPNAPCVQVDPGVKPMDHILAQVSPSQSQPCVYNTVPSGANGKSTYICVVHGRPSKFDIARLPNMPCLEVEPV